MSAAVKWILAIIILAGAGWLLWWSGWLTSKTPVSPVSQTATTTPPAPLNGMSASNDASDAAILQDSTAIDAQMQGYVTDSSNVDSGLGDKSIPQ